MSGLSINATHYQKLQQQPIEIMQALMTPEQFKASVGATLSNIPCGVGVKMLL